MSTYADDRWALVQDDGTVNLNQTYRVRSDYGWTLRKGERLMKVHITVEVPSRKPRTKRENATGPSFLSKWEAVIKGATRQENCGSHERRKD